MTPVRFTPAPDADVAKAARWYESQREGLGLNFIERVDEAVQKIALNSLGYIAVIDDVRRANIRRFPLALWFRL